jgi:hypothetical protein
MQTIDLEIAAQKGRKLSKFLDDLAHMPSNAPGLQSYHAAIAIRNANLRCGVERRCAAVKKAAKQFNVMVSIASNQRGIRTVRLYSPIKQTEIFL